MIKKLVYLVIFILFICCKSDDTVPDCSAVLCQVSMVIVNLIDDTTKENIIIKNSINEENIIVRDASQNLVEFMINETDGFLHINKYNPKDTFEIEIDSQLIATISFNTTKPKTNLCCDFGQLADITVENKSFETDGNKITIHLQ